jgi:hypothetical protein
MDKLDDWSLKVADGIDEEAMYRDMSRLTAAVGIYRSRWADLGYRDETSTALALQSNTLVRLARILGALPEVCRWGEDYLIPHEGAVVVLPVSDAEGRRWCPHCGGRVVT